MADLLFYILSAIALLSGAGVILSRSPMISVLSLLATFFSLAVVYLLAGFQFLAAAQVLVYAGAILVLFLYVIMLLNLGDTKVEFYLKRSLLNGKVRIALVLSFVIGLVGMLATRESNLPTPDLRTQEAGIDDVHNIATALFGRYSLPFEAASVLLLMTMVAVIVLAKRQRSRLNVPRPTENDKAAA